MGKKTILMIGDVFSGYIHAVPIASKLVALDAFAFFHKNITNRFPDCPVAKLRSDNAPEFTKSQFADYCKAARIIIESGAPYSLELQGFAEKKNDIILVKSRTMNIHAGLPSDQWSRAIRVATYHDYYY